MRGRAQRSADVLAERLEVFRRLRRERAGTGPVSPPEDEGEPAPPTQVSPGRPDGRRSPPPTKVLVVEPPFPLDDKPGKMAVEAFYKEQLAHCPPKNTHDRGLLHWSLARVHYQRVFLQATRLRRRGRVETDTEQGLKHLFESSQIFPRESHPIMFGVIQLMTLQLYIQRIQLDPDLVMADAFVLHGLDVGEEAYTVFKQYHHNVELALASIFIAWLYILNNEEDAIPSNSFKSEQSITYLHKALSLIENNALETTSKAGYLQLLLHNKPLSYYEGLCYYLLGNYIFLQLFILFTKLRIRFVLPIHGCE